MSDWYCEILDIRDDCGHKTGKGASFLTEPEARVGFDKARALAVPADRADFLVDCHDDKGDIVDTIFIDAAGFEVLVGEAPTSSEVYAAYDAAYWRRALESLRVN